MATGDLADVLRRIRRQLPDSWFPTVSPNLDAALHGPAFALSEAHAQVAYAEAQARIATATGGWLDLIAWDFFGGRLRRRPGQSDASFRALIIASLLRERATRPAMEKVLLDITGRAPIITEPGRASDGLAWDAYGGYDVGTPWLEPHLRFQAFVTAFRPLPGSDQEGVTDADILEAINVVKPAATKVWVRIFD